jgi:putative aminopeptidase FrvX
MIVNRCKNEEQSSCWSLDVDWNLSGFCFQGFPMQPASVDFPKSVIATASPSGYEQTVAALYRKHVSRFADQVDTDIVGNVIAVLDPGAEMKATLSAHLDEIGFIIHYIGDDGLLYFSPIDGHDSTTLPGQKVWVHGNDRIARVIGRKAIHLLDPDEADQRPAMKDMWIDIGASSRQEAEAVVRLGDVVTFQYEFQMLMGGRATARAFDNKASLAVDMGHATDYPEVSVRQHGLLEIGKGPGIDRGANTNHAVFRILTQAVTEDQIPFQIHVTAGTTPTDAQAMQVSREGMATGLLNVPLRYMPTPCEMLDLTDLDRTAQLAAACPGRRDE